MSRKWDLFEVYRSLVVGIVGVIFGSWSLYNYWVKSLHFYYLILGAGCILVGIIFLSFLPRAKNDGF